jgi:hypothetical protein
MATNVSAAFTAKASNPVQTGGRSLLRLLAMAGFFLLLVIAVLGFRTVVQSPAAGTAQAGTAVKAAFPANPTIEATWGIRFTAVTVLADGGMLEVRYIVLDQAKGERIHSGDVKDLPVLQADDTGMQVRSNSLMFHLHANHIPNEVDGRNYSIIFGNAAGAIHTGGTVTLVLADGLRLQHIPVT